MPDTGGFFRGTAGCTRMQYNCKKETTGMDTFEKIRDGKNRSIPSYATHIFAALLARCLFVTPAYEFCS